MEPLQRLRDVRSGRVWLTVPMLVLGAWALPTQAPAGSQADLEQRVAELEARLLKGPGGSTRIKGPLEVVDAGGSVILRVAQTRSGTAAVEIIHSGPKHASLVVNGNGQQLAGIGAMGQKAMVFVADDKGPRVVLSGEGEVVVLDEAENEVAAMMATEDGGIIAVGTSADSGGSAALKVDEHGGVVSIKATDGSEVAALEVDGESGLGELRIGDDSADVATLGSTKEGAGKLVLWNEAGKVVMNATGGLNGAGGVLIGNAQGLTIWELFVDKAGAGLLRLFAGGGPPAAILGRDSNGGLLQIYNSSGMNVSNLQTGQGSTGYLQLTDAKGATVVEAGGGPGYGIVRAGPRFDCTPRMGKVPQCLVGTP